MFWGAQIPILSNKILVNKLFLAPQNISLNMNLLLAIKPFDWFWYVLYLYAFLLALINKTINPIITNPIMPTSP